MKERIIKYTSIALAALSLTFPGISCSMNSVDINKEVNDVEPVEVVEEEPAIETKVEDKNIESAVEPEPVQESYFDTIDDRLKYTVEEGMFPERWCSDEINPKAESLKPEEIERSKRLAIDSLDNYFEDVLKNNLNTIYFLNYLEFCGVEYAGTSDIQTNAIYIMNHGIDRGATDSVVKGLIHSEFSTVLLGNHIDKFNEAEWKKLNPDGYSSYGLESIKQGKTSKIFDPGLHEMGFLYEYAQCNMVEDFNSFAEYMLSGNEEFWKIYDEYPLIRAKANLVADFYNKLHKGFTIEYFRSLAQE